MTLHDTRTIRERAENALAALNDARHETAEGHTVTALARIEDAHAMLGEILELDHRDDCSPGATDDDTDPVLSIRYRGIGCATVDTEAIPELLANHEESLPDPDDFDIERSASVVAHFITEAASKGVLRLPDALRLTAIGDDDPDGPGLILELAPGPVSWAVTTGWRELVNFQPPCKHPHFDSDSTPDPYSQPELAETALDFACGEINTILNAATLPRRGNADHIPA